jgi:phosphogluconate dehydratase
VLAAIQVTPEAASGGLIGRIRDGDLIHIDADAGVVRVEADLDGRTGTAADAPDGTHGTGRELFAAFRAQVGPAESGASIFGAL